MTLSGRTRKSGSTTLPDPALIEQHRFLKDSEIRLLRELSAIDTWTMLTMVMYPLIWQEHYYEPLHRPLCEFMDSAPHGSTSLIIIARLHRKTYINQAHNTRLIVADPNIRILLISALEGTAEEITAAQKKVFTHNEHFKRIWPEYGVERGTQLGKVAQFTHPMRSTSDMNPTFFSAHLGAALIGRRCDVLKMDDPIDEVKHCATPELAAKSNASVVALNPLLDVNKHYMQTFITGTLKSYNDYYHQVMDKPGYRCMRRAALENDKGEADIAGQPILPNVFSRETLLQLLDKCKADPEKGEPYWWREMMGVVIPPGKEPFKREWFDSWVPRLPANIVWSGIALDSATKDEQILFKGDYTAAYVGHYDSYGHLYLTDCIHSNAYRSADLKRELLAMVQRCQQHHGILVSNLCKEKVGEEALFGMIREAFVNARLPITLYPLQVRGQGKKVVRCIESLQGPLQSRTLHFVGEPGHGYGFPLAVWKGLVDEAMNLGMYSHDDLVDALSLYYHKDIRVTPMDKAGKPWVVRQAAPQQLSTPQVNRSAFSGWRTPSTPQPTPVTPTTHDTSGGWAVRQVDVASRDKHTYIDIATGDTRKP